MFLTPKSQTWKAFTQRGWGLSCSCLDRLPLSLSPPSICSNPSSRPCAIKAALNTEGGGRGSCILRRVSHDPFCPSSVGCKHSTSPAMMIFWQGAPPNILREWLLGSEDNTQWSSSELLTGAWMRWFTEGWTSCHWLHYWEHTGHSWLPVLMLLCGYIVPGSRRLVLSLFAHIHRDLCIQVAICIQMKILHQSLAVLPGLCHKILGTIAVWLCRVKCTTLAEVLSITNCCMESLFLKVELKSHSPLCKVYIYSPLN